MTNQKIAGTKSPSIHQSPSAPPPLTTLGGKKHSKIITPGTYFEVVYLNERVDAEVCLIPPPRATLENTGACILYLNSRAE